jgi:hypothetical protein
MKKHGFVLPQNMRSGNTAQSVMTFLPVSSTTLSYVDEVNSSGFHVERRCVSQ